MRKAAILAAGDGTRIKSISPFKPIVKIYGTTLLDLTFNNLHFKNFEKTVIIFNDDEKLMDRNLLPILNSKKIDFFFKTTPSSMHSLYEVSKRLNINKNEHFFVSMVDSIVLPTEGLEFQDFCKTLKHHESGILATSYIDDEKPLTLKKDNDGYITEFQCKQEEGTLITSGVYYFSSNVIPLLEELINDGQSKMRNFLSELVKRNYQLKVHVLMKSLDIDRPEDILRAERFLKEDENDKC